jgi:hypothetical protein
MTRRSDSVELFVLLRAPRLEELQDFDLGNAAYRSEKI